LSEDCTNDKSEKEVEKMKSLLKKSVIGLFVFMMLASTAAFAQESIKLGMPNVMSGGGAPYAVPMVQGANVAVEEINKKGGVLGRPLQLIVRDDKGKSELASREAEELITKDNVHFLTGTIFSSCALAISAVAKKHKVLFIDCGCRATKLTEEEGHRYVASISVETAYEGRAIAAFDKDTPNKTYWIIGPDYAYGREAADYFKKAIKQIKPNSKILGETWVKMEETEFTAAIGAIVRAKPDMVVSTLVTTPFQAFAKQAQPYGIFKKPVSAIPIVGHTELLRPLGKEYPEGVLCSSKYIEGFLNTPAANSFEKLYLKSTGDKFVPAFAADGYVLMLVFKAVIEKAGKVETEAVIDALEGLTLDTPKGKLTMRACDHKCNIGEWWGITKQDKKLGYAVLTKVKYIPADDLIHTCDEVMESRKK
jgi:branched-chain amino acid transport system substrate-binding protein